MLIKSRFTEETAFFILFKHEPGNGYSVKLLLRRTLVQLDWLWSFYCSKDCSEGGGGRKHTKVILLQKHIRVNTIIKHQH